MIDNLKKHSGQAAGLLLIITAAIYCGICLVFSRSVSKQRISVTKKAVEMGVDFIVLTGNPGIGVTNTAILDTLKLYREHLGNDVVLTVDAAGEGCFCSANGRQSHAVHIDGIDIIALDFLKDQIELTPPVVVAVKLSFGFHGPIGHHSNKHSKDYAQECNDDIVVYSFHIQSNPSTSSG